MFERNKGAVCMMPPGRSQQRCHLGGHRERDKGGLRPHSIQSPFSNQRCNGCSELSLSLMLLLFLVVVISVFFSDLHFKTRDGCQGGWRGFWCLGVIGSRDQTKKGRLQEACLRRRVASLHKSTLTCAFKYPMCKGFIC